MTQSNPHGIKKRRSTNLPHWEQEGANIFVTFRLADSLPKVAIEKLENERRMLERKVARGALEAGEELARFNKLYSKQFEDLLDANSGECLLRDPRCAEIVANALKHFDGERYVLQAWCVMPNHVHAMITIKAAFGLDKILHSWKSFSAKMINKLLGRSGALWQPEYFDRLIRDADELRRGTQYILENPVKIGCPDWSWVDVRLVDGY
jgi:type I restriction enzyme R subunit